MAAITWICWIVGSFFVGLGLLWLGLALFRDRSRGRRRCSKCWYDMAGVPGLTCPECGVDGKRESRFGRTHRHRWQAFFALVVLSVGFLTTRVPAVMERGVFVVVPTPVLRIVLGFFADDAEAAYVAVGSPSSNSLFSTTLGRLPWLPVYPSPPPLPMTWRERVEQDWNNLLVASHARSLIYTNIRAYSKTRLGYDWNDDGWGTDTIGFVLSGIDDERRIAFDAVRALARRSDVPVHMQRSGVQWLATMGFDAAPTRRTLKSIVRSSSAPPSVRLDAIDALQGMEVDPPVYIRALREILVTPDPHWLELDGYSHRAVHFVVKLPIDEALTELLAAIESEHRFARGAAVEGFQLLGPLATPAIPRLVAAAKRESATDELYALQSLAGIGQSATLELAHLMRDASPGRRVFIASTFRSLNIFRLEVIDLELVDLIARDLLDPDVPFSQALLSVARSCGRSMETSLTEISVDHSLEARKRFVLLYVTSHTRQSPEAVVAVLDDHDREVRRVALYELQLMEWAADVISIPIVDALERATDPRDQRDLISLVRRFDIDDDRVTGLLIGRGGTVGAENLGYNALYALEVMGDDREVVIDEAIRLLGDPYDQCRILAARLLGKAGAEAARALPALRAAIENDDLPLDEPATEAMRAISEALRAQSPPGG